MNRMIATVLAAVALIAATGCEPTSGTVVDKDYRTRQTTVNGKAQYEPCWWVKVRDDAGDTHAFCTSRAKWRAIDKGSDWSSK